jgi:transcriptional regulator with XRE-family HTH domain
MLTRFDSSKSTNIATFGERLRFARKNLSIKQVELAKTSGVSQPLISHLEQMKARRSSFVAVLAKALGVSVMWLETGEGNMWDSMAPAVAEDYGVIPVFNAPETYSERA